MAYSIHTDLLGEQKKTAYEPSLWLEIRDNGLPHPQDYSTALPSSVRVGCSTGSEIIILRDGSAPILRITEPETVSQWAGSWSDPGWGTVNPLAIFFDDSYVVAIYYLSGTVYWRRSSDGGQTWGTAQAFSDGGAVTTASHWVGISGGGSKSGVFYVRNPDTVVFRRYDGSTDTWSAEQTTTFSGVSSIDALGPSMAVAIPTIWSLHWWGIVTLII